MADKKEKKLRRLAPCPDYDVERLESWLQDMATEGWLLEKGDIWFGIFTFVQTPSQTIRYRLEPKRKNHSDYTNAPDDEEVELYREYGWEFVTAFHWFYIYRTSDPDARELNTDLAVQSTALKAVKRNTNFSLILQTILVADWFFRIRNEFTRFLVSFDWAFLPLFVIMMVGALIMNGKRFLHIRRLRKQLKNNIPLDHNKSWKKNSTWHRVGSILWDVVLILLIAVLCTNCANTFQEDTSTAEYPGDPPFVTIADLSPSGTYTAQKFGSYNTYKTYSTTLAPNIIEWKEFGEIRAADGIVIDGSLSIDYYETVSPTLARGLVDDFLYYYGRYDDFQIIDAPDIDADYVVAFDYIFPTVLIQQDNIFICATVGLEYQEDYLLEEWAQMMTEFWQ